MGAGELHEGEWRMVADALAQSSCAWLRGAAANGTNCTRMLRAGRTCSAAAAVVAADDDDDNDDDNNDDC